MQRAIAAAELLEGWGYAVHIWSVTSFTELARDAQDCERHNRLHPLEAPRTPYVQQLFAEESGPSIAVSDYMKALPNGIARWMPENFVALGTDGFGLSESRADLRDHYEVSERYIAHAALVALFREGALDAPTLQERSVGLGIAPDKADPAAR